ncbi:hypothetical protein Tco_0575146 [Tanacetum coccineum]
MRDNFSGGGDDEGSVAANSVMPALVDGDRRLEGTGSSVGTVEGSVGARCSSSSSSSSTSSSSLSSAVARHQQIEADPSLVPLAPYQKLTGISMARN